MTVLSNAEECNIDRRGCDRLTNSLKNLGKISIAIEQMIFLDSCFLDQAL